jgi:hypothetical protein
MAVHVADLLRSALANESLAWSDLRRKLPAYALAQAESVLNEQVSQGLLHRHPRLGKRGGDLFGVRPADPKDYLGGEIAAVFHKLEALGFTQAQLRAGALELLHDQEWSPAAEPGEEPADVPTPTMDVAPSEAPAD